MVQIASVVEEAVGVETVRVGPEIRISVDRPHVHEYHRVFGDVEAGWKRSNFCKSMVYVVKYQVVSGSVLFFLYISSN